MPPNLAHQCSHYSSLASLLLQGLIISMDGSKPSSVTACPTAYSRKLALNILEMLVFLSSMHPWWPWWMVCPLGLFIKRILKRLTYLSMCILVCQHPWAFYLSLCHLPWHPGISSSSTKASTLSVPLRPTLELNLSCPLGSLPEC